MILNEKGRALIKKYEGFEPDIYIDAAGHETIGYGHKITTAEMESRVYERTISETEASHILDNDAGKIADVLCSSIDCKLNENEFSAILSLCYNLGPYRFLKSKAHDALMLAKNADGDILDFEKEYIEFRRAGSKILRGLQKRRHDELSLFFTPV